MFIAGLFVLAASELAGIAGLRGLAGDATTYQRGGDAMADTVGQHGWDGAGSDGRMTTSGNAVGSAENAEGQIFVEPQGMCVMSGIGTRQRAWPAKALSSVREHLATSHGIVMLQPALHATITWSSARSPPIRPATRRTAASSATPTHGS